MLSRRTFFKKATAIIAVAAASRIVPVNFPRVTDLNAAFASVSMTEFIRTRVREESFAHMMSPPKIEPLDLEARV